MSDDSIDLSRHVRPVSSAGVLDGLVSYTRACTAAPHLHTHVWYEASKYLSLDGNGSKIKLFPTAAVGNCLCPTIENGRRQLRPSITAVTVVGGAHTGYVRRPTDGRRT